MGGNTAHFQNTVNNVMHTFNQRRNESQNNNLGNQVPGNQQVFQHNLNNISNQINDGRSRVILELCSIAEQLGIQLQTLSFER